MFLAVIFIGLVALNGYAQAFQNQYGRPYAKENMIRGVQGITVVDVGDPRRQILYNGRDFYACPKNTFNEPWQCSKLMESPHSISYQFVRQPIMFDENSPDTSEAVADEAQTKYADLPAIDSSSDSEVAARFFHLDQDVSDHLTQEMFGASSSIFNDEWPPPPLDSIGAVPAQYADTSYVGSVGPRSAVETRSAVTQVTAGNDEGSQRFGLPVYGGSTAQQAAQGVVNFQNQNVNSGLKYPLNDDIGETESRIRDVTNNVNIGHNIRNRYEPVWMQQFGQANGGGPGGGNNMGQHYNKRPQAYADEESSRMFNPGKIINLGNTENVDVDVTNVIASSFNKEEEDKTNILDSFRRPKV